MKLKNHELQNIETIVFDFGNVLLDIDIDLTVEAFKCLGVRDIDPTNIHPHNTGIFYDLEIGRVSERQFLDQIKNMCADPSVISDAQIHEAWNAILLPFDFRRFELLDSLRANYKIALLSNTNEPHHKFFEAKFNRENPARRSFTSYFDHIFYSDELKLRKPGAEIYHKVAQIAQLTAQTTLFIDDNAPNLEEPRKMGWQTHHLKMPQTVFDLFE